jgi:hypothetical protein
VIEQRLHRRIEPVPVAQLERQTFLQVAREDAGGIELLEARQHTFNPIDTATELLRHPVKADAEVAILIEQIEEMNCDDPVALVAKVNSYLLE